MSRFERFIATAFGRNRVWLAGDAAHATVPLGFHSMNRGFSEAFAAAASFEQALREGGRSVSDRIERFDETQSAEWRRLFGMETRVENDGMLSEEEATCLISCLPASGTDLDSLMAQLGLRFA